MEDLIKGIQDLNLDQINELNMVIYQRQQQLFRQELMKKYINGSLN